ncbi:MAG: glycosyltransferase family 2 protein [Muribaculum sp.]|nr:glycosyltransferase family 2 protein [Muribaculum sp.]
MGISVIINTYNSSGTIRKAIESARGFNEIVVCDMESEDNTVDIAMQEGCKVVVFPRGNYRTPEPSRNFAIHSASSKWVLIINADEIIPTELRDYLYDFIKDPQGVSVLYIPRMNFVVNIWKRSSYPDYQLRFFDRSAVYWPEREGALPKVEGKIRKIPATRKDLALRHLAPSISTFLDNLNTQTDICAQNERNRMVTLGRLMLSPLGVFMRVYLLRGAWRYGAAGFISAYNDSVHRYFHLAKVYESEIKKG